MIAWVQLPPEFFIARERLIALLNHDDLAEVADAVGLLQVAHQRIAHLEGEVRRLTVDRAQAKGGE